MIAILISFSPRDARCVDIAARAYGSAAVADIVSQI